MKGEDFKHGETLNFYLDGTLESRTNFINNRQFGKQLFYFKNGKLRTEYFEDSTVTRDFKQYFQNGQLMAESNDLDNGIVHFYDSLGNRTFDIKYLNMAVEDTVKIYEAK